ncbi:FixH family protein [Thalassobacillus devorans]|uniref:FixH family protein n=1 Tax=Thalassobacillus devorans TaxID=279813 RepID=UPI0015948016|nr:FixH family protein [Thalassobacillus devorans]
MRKSLFLLGFFITAIVLTACGGDQSGNAEEEEMEPMIATEVIIPEDIQPGEEATFQAKVTQGDEAVEDADYVKFEFWAEGNEDEDNEKVEAEHQGDGVYEVSYTFPEEGVYFLYAHTQASDMHVMPKEQFTVGDGETEEVQEKAEEDQSDEHHDSKDIKVAFDSNGEWKPNEEAKLEADITQNKKPFENATVQFEIVSDKLDKHIFVDAAEQKPGEYEGKYTFPSTGNYELIIHYVKEETHDHISKQVKINE